MSLKENSNKSSRVKTGSQSGSRQKQSNRKSAKVASQLLKPHQKCDLEFSGNKMLHEPIVVVIGSSDGISQYTIHKPIGNHHDCQQDDWVISLPEEVDYMLKHSADPYEKSRNVKVQQSTRELMAEQAVVGQYQIGLTDNSYKVTLNGKDRNEILDLPRRLAKAAKKSSASYLDFLNEEEGESERLYIQMWASCKVKAEVLVGKSSWKISKSTSGLVFQEPVAAFRGLYKHQVLTILNSSMLTGSLPNDIRTNFSPVSVKAPLRNFARGQSSEGQEQKEESSLTADQAYKELVSLGLPQAEGLREFVMGEGFDLPLILQGYKLVSEQSPQVLKEYLCQFSDKIAEVWPGEVS